MVTISHIVKKTVDSRPMLQEALIEGIVSYGNLSKKMKPKIESELGKEAKRSAISMALRRHAENLQKKTVVQQPFEFNREIIMKTNLCDICIVRTPSALEKIEKMYDMVNYEKGDTLNVLHGNHEIAIVISQKYLKKLRDALQDEKIFNIEKNLVSLTLKVTDEFLYTPGILSLATRKLAWENINIFENISTMTEIIFIIAEKDAVSAYNAFQEMIKEYSTEE